MRMVAIGIVMGVEFLAWAGEEEPVRPDLSWLVGSWKMDADGSVWEEHWFPMRGDTMIAATRWVKEGKTRLYELSAIEPGEKGPTLRIRHFSPGLVPWKSEADGPESWPFKSADENEIVFEEPGREGVSRVTYRRDGDSLVVRLDSPSRLVARFVFQRVG